jgi:hypothetical protein
VNCANNVTGTIAGSLTASGGSWCINNASIGGSLTVTSGTTAVITNSSTRGSVTGNSPAGMSLCNDTVIGNVKITNATGFVLVGDPGDDACVGNNIHGGVTLNGDTAGVELSHSTIGASVAFNDNAGVNFFDDQVPEVAGNTIGGNLGCTGNTPFPGVKNDGEPNNVTGPRKGQCATL